MEYKIKRASNRKVDYPEAMEYDDNGWSRHKVDINTLEDFEKIEKYYNSSLIINFKCHEITVYDGYIE